MDAASGNSYQLVSYVKNLRMPLVLKGKLLHEERLYHPKSLYLGNMIGTHIIFSVR
jgi:hypothetical protein